MRRISRRASILFTLLLLGSAGLAGCGQMGPLVLPDDADQADADEDANGGDDERRD